MIVAALNKVGAQRAADSTDVLGVRRYRPHLTAEVSLAELEGSDEAVGAGPGIDEQRRRAQRDKVEVLLERCVLQYGLASLACAVLP